MSELHTVRSQDGTTIGYETFGAGAPLVLVHGGISDRSYWTPVVPALAERFTVVTVDRRGRGASGDAAAYTVEREFEDLAAVIDAIGEPAHLVGHSYGGICALEAALLTRGLRTLTLYEPAFGYQGAIPVEVIAGIEAQIAAGESDAAVASFMGGVLGMPADTLAELRADTAAWQPMVGCVHTFPRELRTVAGLTFEPDRFRGLAVPTVLLRGTEGPADVRVGVDLVSGAVPGSRVVTMQGVDHEAVTTGPDVLVAALFGALSEAVSA